MSLLLPVVYLLFSLFSISRGYDAVAVTGEYPIVLPRSNNQQSVGYDKSSNNIVILGGANRQEGVEFNIGNNKFNDLGDNYMSTGAYGNSYYTTINNILWIIAGGDKIIRMNTETRSMDYESIDIPTTVSPHACLTSTSKYVFVIGGWNSNQMLHLVQIYDISHNKWLTNVPEMKESRAVCGCVVNNNNLYVIAGLQSDSIEYINVNGNLDGHINSRQWIYVDDTFDTTLRALTAVNYGDDIIIIGGRQDTDNNPIYLDTIPVLDTNTNTLSIVGNLAYSVTLTCVIVVNNKLYAFGGQDNSAQNIDTYQYIILPVTPEDNSLSFGSILLIIFFVSVFIYCFFGYIFYGYKSKKWSDIKNNIPQYSFWKTIPQWTFTGCKISYEFLKQKVGKEKQSLIDTDAQDVDIDDKDPDDNQL